MLRISRGGRTALDDFDLDGLNERRCRVRRFSVEQAAWILGCQIHDMPILISSKLLKPLGNPAPNAIKFFATADVLDLVKDRSWLAKITNIIGQHWHKRNVRQKSHSRNGSQNGHSRLLDVTAATAS
jgi:hypothetical protein